MVVAALTDTTIFLTILLIRNEGVETGNPIPYSRLNRTLVHTLSATSASSSLQRLSTFTSQPTLKASKVG